MKVDLDKAGRFGKFSLFRELCDKGVRSTLAWHKLLAGKIALFLNGYINHCLQTSLTSGKRCASNVPKMSM